VLLLISGSVTDNSRPVAAAGQDPRSFLSSTTRAGKAHHRHSSHHQKSVASTTERFHYA
jgi:hypothetical protein